MVALLDKAYGLHLHTVSDNRLKICTLKGKEGYILFVFNYGKEEIKSEVKLTGVDSQVFESSDLYCGKHQDLKPVDRNLRVNVSVKGKDVSVLKLKYKSGDKF